MIKFGREELIKEFQVKIRDEFSNNGENVSEEVSNLIAKRVVLLSEIKILNYQLKEVSEELDSVNLTLEEKI